MLLYQSQNVVEKRQSNTHLLFLKNKGIKKKKKMFLCDLLELSQMLTNDTILRGLPVENINYVLFQD